MERLLSDASKLTGKKYDINNLSDVYEAIHAIQENLGVTGTTAEEAGITFEGSFNAMKAAATNLLSSLAMGEGIEQSLMALVGTIGTFVTNNLLPMVGTILVSLANLIKNNIGKVPALIDTLGNNLLAKAPALVTKGLVLFSQLAISIIKATPKIVSALGVLLLRIVAALLKGAIKFLSIGGKWVGSLISGVKARANGLIDNMGGLAGKALRAIRDGLPKFIDLGGDMVKGLIQGVKNFAGSLGTAIKDLVRSAFKSGKKEAKVGSPSRLFRDGIGKWIPLGVAEGVNKYAYALDDAVDKMVLSSMSDPQQNLPTAPSRNITSGVSDSVVNGLSTIAAGMGNNGGTIQVNTYLYPNSAEAGKAIYRLNEIWKGRLNNG